jgi:hypothetical protein
MWVMKAPTQHLADWAEARFHDSLDLGRISDRLYGATILDADGLADRGCGAARLSYLGSVDDIGDLLGARIVLELGNFDAAVLLAVRWMVDDPGTTRPGAYDVRRRARIVLVSDRDGMAATVRFAHRVDHPEPRLPAGTEAVVLRALWQAAHQRR